MNKKQEQEWESEYNLKKEKRKWLFKKKKQELLELTSSDKTKKIVNFSVKIIGAVVISYFIITIMYFVIVGLINYTESQKYINKTPQALERIETKSKASLGLKINVGEIPFNRSTKNLNYVLSDYKINTGMLTFKFSPDFTLDDISRHTPYPTLESEILKSQINMNFLHNESELNTFICGLSDIDDMKSLAYSNIKIVIIFPDIEKPLNNGNFADKIRNIDQVSFFCSLDTKWGFMSSIQ